MKNKEKLKEFFKRKYPIWGYSPKGISDPTLSIELSKLNGIGLIDLEGLTKSQSKEMILKCFTELDSSKLWGVRVKDENQFLWLEEFDFIPIIIVAFDLKKKVSSSFTTDCELLIAEVSYFEQALEKSDWADMFLVKGFESGGMIGEKSSFILIQQFNESGFPFVIQGGLGVYNIISSLVGGALGVVLEGQLYLLPECPLSNDVKEYISSLEENDTYVIGESFDTKYRLVGKIANQSIREAKKLEKTTPILEKNHFQKIIKQIIGDTTFFNEEEIKHAPIPVGIEITFANFIRDEFRDLKTFLASLAPLFTKQIEGVSKEWPFRKNSEFAKKLGIELPIIQGPMANISDNAEFARLVAENGVLPILGLGGLLKEETEELFSQMNKKMPSGKMYGGGIIGLEVMKERREDHITLLQKNKTPICLLAAGTVQLASRIKNLGFTTFLHTPALSLIKDALKNNIEYLILEGSEAGGHIGTQTSFTLWERILQYLTKTRNEIKDKVNIIFAGGIGDEFGSAMLAVMIGSHLDIVSPAIQMGTAYLFTEEIVNSKALTPKYQEKVMDNFSTNVIGATVNTRARVVTTEFVHSTLKKEFERVKEGTPITERKEAYEKDNLGALRIATKAEIWNNDHVPGGDTTQFVHVTPKQQEKLGCFMTGEIAGLKRNIIRIENLHYDIIVASKQLFLSFLPELEAKVDALVFEEDIPETTNLLEIKDRVAIVGLGCIFPDSPNIEAYWQNIVQKVNSITVIPEERWESDLYYDPDPKAVDKTYSKIGAFVKDYEFNSIGYRIPPTIASKMDAVQKWSLDAAKEALEDAGIPTDGKVRLPIAVIVGNAVGGENQRATNRRIFIPEVLKEIRQNQIFNQLAKDEQDEFIKQIRESYSRKFKAITEDTMPGELSNVIAGRIANVFNFTGKSMTTDAACASSVASLDTAIKALITYDFDVALVGGADRSMDPTSFVKFSKIGALSATGSRPFDEKADGFVMGEGAGFLVLKRLEDAIKDGNKIYTVISAIGASSDGKGKGITAPNPEGQKQSILMALNKAKLQSEEIQYIEAHGTSTTVGDAVELKVLEEIFKSDIRKEKIAVGSIKSQIGHLKSAAGIAALIKTSLAIYNKILPPSINVETPNPNIEWKISPLFVNTEPTDWKVNANEIRRAGVSSFGFGGTNYHAILEEFDPVKVEYSHAAKISLSQSFEATPAITQVQEAIDENPICFMFTGQGSQYLGMLKRLYETSKTVADTFEEAEKIWFQHCSFSMKDIVFGSEGLTQEANSQRLTDTKFTQPALFVVDIALFRYMKEQGITPSYVAGHSLGEYSALVAAGVLSFSDGLKAVIARGRSMSDATKETEGAMAAVLAPTEQVEKLVNSIKDEYVIVANYNSTGQTVVSGSVEGIDKIIQKASKMEITSKKLRVSTAFHSKIVKSVEAVMRKVLFDMTFNPPKMNVYSNVTGKKYPSQPDLIQNLLIEQICSSVQWVEEINNIYNDGARIFVEVGPKKALFYFAKDILKSKRDIQVLNTLSPKEKEDEKIAQTIDKIKEIVHSSKIEKTKTAVVSTPRREIMPPSTDMDFNQYLLRNKEHLHDFLKQGYELYSTFMKDEKETISYPTSQLVTSSIGVTGVGIGIPGKSRNVFDDKNIDLLLKGANLIEGISEELKNDILEKNIVRLVKSANGSGSFEHIDDITKVVQLAGQLGKFDPENDFGLNPKLLNALDISFQLAICAGLEALKDAGIPLIRSKKKTSTGKILEGEWELPKSLQDSTGIIFSSAFPGFDNIVKELKQHYTSKEEHQFKREFIFKILSMGHSQFAQLIKAKGPNTQINAACASTTQAIGIAEDWIKIGRCERVIVIAADDAANENLLPWIGAGFLAAGGISTKAKVEEAAIPFGKNRHGLIVGSAAAGYVIEKEEAYQKRGVKPIADIIGTHFANSAFHGARLNVSHITKLFGSFIETIEKEKGISRNDIATEGMFVSHETYTPARGGSAEAEIESLRSVFGSNASKMIIINTKGYTGHPMGAGIEEGLAIKAMEKGFVPPIANINEIDPNFADLNFSRGLEKRLKYAVRLAAGFGSQVAFAAFKLNTYKGRFDSPEYERWLNTIGGKREGIFKDGRVLKLKESPKEELEELLKPRDVLPSVPTSDILTEIISVIAEKTGYESNLIEANMNLEDDLGIDTVKQAEIFGIVREKWNIDLDETVNLADFTTAEKIVEYIHQHTKQTIVTTGIESKKEEIGESNLKTSIKKIISRTTGYEVELIDDDMDLEEDLGIDTIKQAEIFGEIREEFNLPLDESVNLAAFRTINDISEYFTQNISSEASISEVIEQESTQEEVTSAKISKDSVRIEKLVQAPVPMDLENIERIKLSDLSNLIINLNSSFAEKIEKEFTKKKIEFVSHELLKKAPSSLKSNKFDNFILILPDKKTTPGFIDQEYYEKLFSLFQHLDLNSEQKITAISPEKFFGYEEGSYPLSGGISGFIKTLGHEFEIQVKHLYSEKPSEIMKELEFWDTNIEISYSNSIRYTLVPTSIEETISDVSELDIGEKDVLLVTGGGRGITFKCIEAVCEIAKPKVALLGIEDISECSVEDLKLTETELKDRKQKMIEKLRETEEKVTPVMIDKKWNQFIFNLEVLENIQTLEQKGIIATYHRTDVTNKEAVADSIKKIEEEFRSKVTHIVHGAGLEESKQFKKKKFDFSRFIVSVKVEGIWNILDAVDMKKLKRVICFTSIAGRFGNMGQIDYSFANGYLSRLCWMLSQQGIPSLAYDWSAWGDIGMATRGSIMQILESQGIYPIPMTEGIKTFVNLFSNYFSSEVVVSRGLGPFDKLTPHQAKITDVKFPMIDKVEFNKPVFRGDYSITTENDLYMLDHQIENTPIFPGVMGLEIFAEIYSLVSRKKTSTLEDIEFKSAIKQLHNKPKEVYVEYNPITQNLSLKSDFVPKIAEKRIMTTEHFSGRIGNTLKKKRSKKRNLSLNESTIELMTKEEIYSIFFHGNSFQVLEKLIELSGEKAFTKVCIPEEKLFSNLKSMVQIQPRAIEAAFQTAGLYDLIVNQKTSLPSKIKEVAIYSNKTPKYIISEFINKDSTHSFYNVEVIDEEGKVIIRLDQLAMIHTQFSFKGEEDFSDKKNQLREYWEISSNFKGKRMKVVPIKGVTNYLSNEPEEVLKYLSSKEKAAFNRIKNEKRRIEYLSGVIATKELYSEFQEDKDVLKKIEIRKMEKGQPFLFDKEKGKRSNIHLSISHSGDFAVSTLSEKPVGVDIEKIEKRDEGFFKEAFTEEERKIILNDDNLGTIIWTIKEAVSKALGEGLHLSLHDVEIFKEKKSENYRVNFSNNVKETIPYDSSSFKLENQTSTNYSISYCEIEKGSKQIESRKA